MAYSETLADRVRAVFARQSIVAIERRMMGGLCFMIDDKMCVCVGQDRLMARLDPERLEWALQQPGCQPVNIAGRPMRGFLWIDPEGHDTQHQLEQWLNLALEYNPHAKSSKRKGAQPPKKQRISRKRPGTDH